MREAEAGVVVAAVTAVTEVVAAAVVATPSPSEAVAVVWVVVEEGADVWPVARMGKAAAMVVVVVAAAVMVVVVVAAAGVKSEAPGAAASVPVVGLVEKAKVCMAGAADLAGSGTAPVALVGPPNCRVGVAVEAEMVVGSWKLDENPVLVVAGAGAEKLKEEAAEEAGGARNPAPGAAVCCCCCCCWFVVAAEKSPLPVVVAAVLELAAGVDVVPKLNGEVPEGCEVARAVPKLKPLVPPAVEVVRVGKLNAPPPVVFCAAFPKLKFRELDIAASFVLPSQSTTCLLYPESLKTP